MNRTTLNSLLAFSLLLMVSACSHQSRIDRLREDNSTDKHKRSDSWLEQLNVNPKDKIDPYNNLDREDYMEIGAQRKLADNFSSSKIQTPKMQDILADVDDEFLANDKLVSISVNENVPLKEVLVELARRAEVDVEIDKNINDNIIFIAKDKPFSQVIKRIARIAGLRYDFEDGVLRIEKDNPVIKSYKFNMLDITRSSSSSVNSSLSVGGESGDGGSAAVTGGSSSQVDTASGDGDVWSNVESGVSGILSKYSSKSSEDGGSSSSSSILSLNKSAGVVSVLATDSQHKAVKEYLDSIHMSLTSQVLIEAKVLEVTLDDKYNSGIDWNVVTSNLGIGAQLGADASAFSFTPGADEFKVGVLPTSLFGNDNVSISAGVELLETFGVTRSLSNPRINTMNNQFAILNFSQNEVYFDVTLEKEEEEATDRNPNPETTITVDSEIRTVPIGIVLTLQPSIDLDRNEITMNVKPTLTRVTDRVSNPGVTIIAADIDGLDADSLNAEIPVVEVRELDTVLRAQSGEIMVIGGLLEERTLNTDTGVPGLSRIPYLGNAFKRVSKETTMVETVIFIKPTIIPGKGVSVEDKDFYKKFNRDNRAFNVD